MEHNVQIGVVTHKEFPYSLPVGYDRIQVGCALRADKWDGYIHDDDGDNISEKNGSYCELTALYWLWKNSDAEIKGLCHYRRFFSDYINDSPNMTYFTKGDKIAHECIQLSTAKTILKEKDMIVVRPQLPYCRTVKEDLLLYCYEKDIAIMTDVICEFYPEYKDAYNYIMDSHNVSYYNMMITNKSVFDGYCEWLFSVLAYCEERCNLETYDVQHKRLFGYLAEVLLNVYIEKHRLECVHARTVFVSEYHPQQSLKQLRSSCYTECITRMLYKIGFGKLVEILYGKYRSETYKRYMQYLKWCENK